MKNYHTTLFPYAYNILGSVEDAKDAVQDVLMRYLSIDKKTVKNETGYLIKSTVNQSINIKNKRNRIQNERIWLPEPFATEKTDDNIDGETILSYSLLVLLEKLTAKERAVFILKEAFDFSHKEIASAIDFSIENSRKLLSRAKTKLENHKTERDKNQLQQSSYLENFMHTIKNGDISGLEKLLSEDILLAADGGENIKVVRELTRGIKGTSKLLMYVYKAFLDGLKFTICTINHQPAILFYQNDVVYNCQVFDLDDDRIQSIYSIVDPSKLKLL